MTFDKAFEKYLIDTLVTRIQKEHNVKTKKQAREILFDALSHNVVIEELFNMIEHLQQEKARLIL